MLPGALFSALADAAGSPDVYSAEGSASRTGALGETSARRSRKGIGSCVRNCCDSVTEVTYRKRRRGWPGRFQEITWVTRGHNWWPRGKSPLRRPAAPQRKRRFRQPKASRYSPPKVILLSPPHPVTPSPCHSFTPSPFPRPRSSGAAGTVPGRVSDA